MEDNDNDMITVSAIIGTFLVERLLPNDGSIVEVLIRKAFQEMSLDENQLRPAGSIYGFVNQPIREKGVITLLITIGQSKQTIKIGRAHV